MTDRFRELSNRLAQGLNLKGGMAVLITTAPEEDEIKTFMKGHPCDILGGICLAINASLEKLCDNDARLFRDRIKQELIADEERRFQKGETE